VEASFAQGFSASHFTPHIFSPSRFRIKTIVAVRTLPAPSSIFLIASARVDANVTQANLPLVSFDASEAICLSPHVLTRTGGE
jgi:hypothetical protein